MSWTKTEFPVFVNFSHGEGTTGSDYYLRRSDTAINIFEHAVVQMSIRYCYGTRARIANFIPYEDNRYAKHAFHMDLLNSSATYSKVQLVCI